MTFTKISVNCVSIPWIVLCYVFIKIIAYGNICVHEFVEHGMDAYMVGIISWCIMGNFGSNTHTHTHFCH